MSNELQSTEAILKKYTKYAFMYVEYPHKSFWSKEFGNANMKDGLIDLFAKPEAPVLLYVHMPYCQKMCWYCTCHVFITQDYKDVTRYLELLYQEIELYRAFFESIGVKPNFREVHLGGGSPTYIREPEFREMMERLGTIADFSKLDEFAIEIDPRRVKEDRMGFYHQMGINRISFGVQDFDLKVQRAVNRVQPTMLTERLLTPEIRSLFQNGVNFDIICGLPHQTEESMAQTMETVVRLSPDRVCLNYLDYSPRTIQFFPHQQNMPENEIPRGVLRKKLFTTALKILERGGYERMGYDHFAKSTDSVAKAGKDGNMVWNPLGVTPGRYEDIIGIGVSGSSRLGPGYYAQNEYDIDRYKEKLRRNEFPVFRGCKLSKDDIIRREVIHRLRNYFFVEFPGIEEDFQINFREYFQHELVELADFMNDGVVSLDQNSIKISEFGHQFTNVVCEIFDAHLAWSSLA